jgi:hypothetical protein
MTTISPPPGEPRHRIPVLWRGDPSQPAGWLDLHPSIYNHLTGMWRDLIITAAIEVGIPEGERLRSFDIHPDTATMADRAANPTLGDGPEAILLRRLTMIVGRLNAAHEVNPDNPLIVAAQTMNALDYATDGAIPGQPALDIEADEAKALIRALLPYITAARIAAR